MNNNAIILAAGKGTRMKSKVHKVLHEVLGKSMINHVIDHLNEANINRKVVIIGHDADEVKKAIGHQVEFSLQSEQLGTGHAVMMAEPLLKDEEGITLVICGDTPLISANTINNLLKYHQNQSAHATILTTIMDDPTGYGRIIRHTDQTINKIVEHKEATSEEKKIREINTGTYCFNNKELFYALKSINNNNAQGEYYLTDVIEVLKNNKKKVTAYINNDSNETLGINDRISLGKANELLKGYKNEQLMRDGVTIVDPSSTIISVDSKIGPDTIIYPGTVILGNNTIGSDCIIGPNTELNNVHIGNNVTIKHSVVSDSTIGNETTVGPFAHFRNHAHIGDSVRIGNFVEIKNSHFGNNSNAAHLSYIGDAEVGQHVNMGCGSITVNYDGVDKYKTIIEDNTFIGCNSNLVAPIKIGRDAYVAAGSTLTQDVPDEALAIGRGHQVNKLGYAKKYKK